MLPNIRHHAVRPRTGWGIRLAWRLPKRKVFRSARKTYPLADPQSAYWQGFRSGKLPASSYSRRSGAQRGTLENTSARGLSGCPFAIRSRLALPFGSLTALPRRCHVAYRQGTVRRAQALPFNLFLIITWLLIVEAQSFAHEISRSLISSHLKKA